MVVAPARLRFLVSRAHPRPRTTLRRRESDMRCGRLFLKVAPHVRSGTMRGFGIAALTALAMASFAPSASAQATGSVSGRVTDATTGVPLGGVNVRVSTTAIGAQTTEDGRYTIRGVKSGV